MKNTTHIHLAVYSVQTDRILHSRTVSRYLMALIKRMEVLI